MLAYTNPLTRGKTFKARLVGAMRKDLQAGKLATAMASGLPALMGLPDSYELSNVDDPNCGLPYDVIEENVFANCFEFRIGVPDSAREIMLGESKYFYAINDPEEDAGLLIKEFKLDSATASFPTDLPEGGLTSAFSSDELIEVVSGGKSGVYWERKRAEISGTGEVTMHELPKGMVRVIGRYWEADTEYKVKLKASTSDRAGELELVVVRPDKLGDTYNRSKDVFDKEYDVDSLIIKYSGEYGIPPQIIKAHISVEAAKNDFGGNIGWGFAPSYRYEPYTVQLWDLKYCCSNYFFKDSASADFSDVPNHQYVLDRNYYTEVQTVWEIIKEESQLVNSSNGNSYGKRDANGKMNFGKYTTIQTKYNSLYIGVSVDTALTVSQIADSTNKLMINYMENEWENKITGIKGANNMIAQTRAASSYGFLQMLYSTALKEVKYEKTKVPEKMNEQAFFVFFIQYQQQLMQDRKKDNEETEFNWDEGYELLIRNSVFEAWNTSPKYPEAVLKRVQEYYPTNND